MRLSASECSGIGEASAPSSAQPSDRRVGRWGQFRPIDQSTGEPRALRIVRDGALRRFREGFRDGSIFIRHPRPPGAVR